MATELEMLRSYARRCSIALCNLSGGGSELFTRIGEQHYAEPELCQQRIEEKMSRMWRHFRTVSGDAAELSLLSEQLRIAGADHAPGSASNGGSAAISKACGDTPNIGGGND